MSLKTPTTSPLQSSSNDPRVALFRAFLVQLAPDHAESEWQNFAELRTDFGSADQVERRTVFNIGGNSYRLIARVNYKSQRLFILYIMKHAAEYLKGKWK